MKRSAKYKRERIHTLLSAKGRFNMDYGASFGKWFMPDKNFRYRQNAFHRFISFSVRCFLCVFGTLLIKLLYGAKVRGKDNLKALKGQGAICLCNHFHILDTLFVRSAVGHFRSYHTVAPFNNKKGVLGAVMRHGGLLPFSSDLAALKNLDSEMERLLSCGKIINFYPEQALWSHYDRPRPMKRGAFYYAAKYGVPVLPVFCTFEETKRGKLRKLRINILPPVFPVPELNKRENEARMKELSQSEWLDCYLAYKDRA